MTNFQKKIQKSKLDFFYKMWAQTWSDLKIRHHVLANFAKAGDDTGLVTNTIIFCWLFTIKDQYKKCVFNQRRIKVCVSCSRLCPGTSAPSGAHLRVFLYLCSNARGESRGSWRGPCQLKEPFKGPRQGSCWEEWKRTMPLMRGHWFALHQGKSMMFYKKATEKDWVSGPTFFNSFVFKASATSFKLSSVRVTSLKRRRMCKSYYKKFSYFNHTVKNEPVKIQASKQQTLLRFSMSNLNV